MSFLLDEMGLDILHDCWELNLRQNSFSVHAWSKNIFRIQVNLAG